MVFFDALRVKIRDEGFVRNKAVYVALAITADGDKEVLGLWIDQTEGAKFWLKVMNEHAPPRHRVRKSRSWCVIVAAIRGAPAPNRSHETASNWCQGSVIRKVLTFMG